MGSYKRPRRLRSIFGIEEEKPKPRKDHGIWVFLVVIALIGGLLAALLLISGDSPEEPEDPPPEPETAYVVEEPEFPEEDPAPEKPPPAPPDQPKKKSGKKGLVDLLDRINRDFSRLSKCPDFKTAREPNAFLDEIARDFYKSSLPLEEKILVASGVNESRELKKQVGRLKQVLDQVVAKAKKAKTKDGGTLAEYLRTVLHAGPLKQYRSRASHLPSVLKNGKFNCLTGTALYWFAARRLGLPVSAYTMKGHILPVVHLPEGPVLIESTSTLIEPIKVFSETADRLEKSHNREFILGHVQALIDLARKRALAGDLKTAGQLSREAWLLKEEFEREASKWSKINSGLSEVDPAALAAFFLNNLHHDVEDPVVQLRMFVAMLELFQQSKARRMVQGMMKQLKWITDTLSAKYGPECGVSALGYMIEKNHHLRLQLRLRDVRAKLLDEWVSSAKGSARKNALRRAAQTDPEHPLVKKLQQKYH